MLKQLSHIVNIIYLYIWMECVFDPAAMLPHCLVCVGMAKNTSAVSFAFSNASPTPIMPVKMFPSPVNFKIHKSWCPVICEVWWHFVITAHHLHPVTTTPPETGWPLTPDKSDNCLLYLLSSRDHRVHYSYVCIDWPAVIKRLSWGHSHLTRSSPTNCNNGTYR